MKITLTLLIILSLVLIPFTPFSQNTATSTAIASVEYLEKQPPVEKKAKKKKRKRKRLKQQLKQQKKHQKNNNRKGLPITFLVIASLLFIGFLAWIALFFPLLASSSLASSVGCIAPLIAVMLGVLGIFFSLILLAGVIILTIFAVIIINRNKSGRVEKASTSSTNKNQPEEDDFIKIQILDKASKDFPGLAPETLEKYVNIKDSIVELKYERSKLDAIKASGSTDRRLQEKMDSLNRSIATKEVVIDAIEEIHADLEPIPSHKRLPYTNIKIKLAKLKLKQEQYQQDDDFRSISKLREVEKAIKEQEEELKLLLGIYRD